MYGHGRCHYILGSHPSGVSKVASPGAVTDGVTLFVTNDRFPLFSRRPTHYPLPSPPKKLFLTSLVTTLHLGLHPLRLSN